MASLAMASSVAVFVAAPTVAVSQASFSAVSSVKLAPMRFNRHMSVVAMATPAGSKKENFGDKVSQRIEDAQRTCEDDPTSAPCAAAWDDVELPTSAIRRKPLATQWKNTVLRTQKLMSAGSMKI